MSVMPRGEIEALGKRLRASRQKRPQRQHQHLIESSGRIGVDAGLPAGVRFDAGRCLVPRRHEWLEGVAIPAERDDLLVIGALEDLETLQDVGGLTERQTKIGPVERDVPEADERPAGRLLRAEPFRIHLNPRQRHAPLHAALHVDEGNLHVDRRCELGLRDLELPELDDFARLGARRADGTVSHCCDCRSGLPAVACVGHDGASDGGWDGEGQVG